MVFFAFRPVQLLPLSLFLFVRAFPSGLFSLATMLSVFYSVTSSSLLVPLHLHFSFFSFIIFIFSSSALLTVSLPLHPLFLLPSVATSSRSILCTFAFLRLFPSLSVSPLLLANPLLAGPIHHPSFSFPLSLATGNQRFIGCHDRRGRLSFLTSLVPFRLERENAGRRFLPVVADSRTVLRNQESRFERWPDE